jgi:UDP-glucuronate decarboxylase
MIETPSQITGPINLGNPNEITILGLAEAIIKLTNSKSKVIKEALPSDDPKQRKPDISKAEEILNWKPVVKLEVGLAATIEDFMKRLKNDKRQTV